MTINTLPSEQALFMHYSGCKCRHNQLITQIFEKKIEQKKQDGT